MSNIILLITEQSLGKIYPRSPTLHGKRKDFSFFHKQIFYTTFPHSSEPILPAVIVFVCIHPQFFLTNLVGSCVSRCMVKWRGVAENEPVMTDCLHLFMVYGTFFPLQCCKREMTMPGLTCAEIEPNSRTKKKEIFFLVLFFLISLSCQVVWDLVTF